jgi:hypothetical protein
MDFRDHQIDSDGNKEIGRFLGLAYHKKEVLLVRSVYLLLVQTKRIRDIGKHG